MSRYAFAQDRSTYVREQLLETTDGVESAVDLAAATLKVYLRAYAAPSDTAFLLDLLLDKVAITGGDYVDAGAETSGVEGYVRFTSGYSLLKFRMVLVDEAVADAETSTGYREMVRQEWSDHVSGSPQIP